MFTAIRSAGFSTAALVMLCLTEGVVGCSKQSAPAFCPGGYVRTLPDAGQLCEGLCEASLCRNPNNVCVDNRCELQCASDSDCPVGQGCSPATEDQTGKSISVCASNGKGAIGTPCPQGSECSGLQVCDDGSPCPASGNCDGGACHPLTCTTPGGGDARAYCTMSDCKADSDCPGGYWCPTLRVGDQICGQAAPPSLCGKPSQMQSCVMLSSDTTFAQGALCTERNECRLRNSCAPCTTDLDCSRVEGQHCVQGSCAAACGSDADCENGLQCTAGACVPRAGTCAAPAGTGKLCDPCRIDADCGPGAICGHYAGLGLGVCIIPKASSCTTDADCPATSSGLHATCYQGTCEAVPVNPNTNEIGCFCANKGAACLKGTDCCSGTCQTPDAGSSSVFVNGTCN